MATKIDLTKELSQISKDIEDTLKDIIQKEGLIDTGRLYNSVSVTIKGNEIDVETEDYYKYLDEDYQLTKQLENSTAFDNAIKRLEEGISKQIENNI
jgi:molecular chaperone DnaK (HSP70)